MGIDRISKAIAGRRNTVHSAFSNLIGSAVVARQDTLPAPDAEHGPTMLFVQTYQSGTITPIDGVENRYTLTLESGTGQTVYFSDRPDRIVGSNPTPQFLEELGFFDDNPPNAALVVETAPGETDVAVVELFSPVYDPVSQGVTFEIAELADWQRTLDVGFTEGPTDLSALAPSFSSARLFIDDCPDMPMDCVNRNDLDGPAVATIGNKEHDGFCYGWAYGACLPCQPWYSSRVDAFTYWTNQCNSRFNGCHGECVPRSVCSDVIGCR